MADVASNFASWSSVTNNNNPQGTATVGNGVDDNIRELMGVVVRGLSHKGSDISSSSTIDIGAVEGLLHTVTGSSTISSLGTVRSGIWKILRFSGQLTLTYNATSLILPGAANITTADGDVAIFFSEGSGNWRCISYQYATNGQVPVGSVMPFAGLTEPAGWLFCYGQAVSRTTYGRLFSVLSTTYGAGDSSTTFNLPDLRGRVVAGQDDMGGTSADRLTSAVNGDTLGAAGGSETHTLTTAEMPAHTHSSGTTSSAQLGGAQFTTGGSNDTAAISTASTGGGGAHNNVQPTFILNYCIKY